MNKFLSLGVTGFLAVFAITGFADTGADSVPETRLERMINELQLTAEQKSALEAIFNEKREKVREIREDTQSQIKDVLTDEQLEKWDELKRQRIRSRIQGRGLTE